MSELLFITSNKNKLREIESKIGSSFQLKNLNDINFHDDIPELFETINENAIAKAKFIFDKFQINCFAEDSGLVVEALNGEPGVYSARYAGAEKNDAANIQKVLQKLEHETNRKAYFITVIALYFHNQLHTFEGRIYGNITHQKQGSGGFGYDPIFIADGFESTFAEIGLEIKNKISHRAKAVEQMISFLKSAT
jgi:XTP/dITP diphosphohydrolase